MEMYMKCTLKMSVISFGLILFSNPAAVFAVDEVNGEVNPNQGRFKIFIAEHNAILKGKNITMKSIFKMDKETGTVWRYRQGMDSKGKPYEEFFEVPNQ